jgi:phosphoribosylaminoimidazole-succinocarboxamide synthase
MLDQETIRQLLPVAFATSDLPLDGKSSGKVRDSYALPDGHRLLVTTDRLSAFDRVLARVPYKGQVLNQLSAWWFARSAPIIDHHMLAVPDPNAMLVVEAEPFPIEVIVRGYISGVTSTALWYRYSLGERQIYGYQFPPGLRKNQALHEPIITPTTKGGESGHDERLTVKEVVQRGFLPADAWEQIQSAALAVFKLGQTLAERAGLILVDTKYEFGCTADGRILLIDEVHTPDSSRFWKADTYPQHFAAGEEPENFDKEFVRLAYAQQGYRGDGDPPAMPADLWVGASQRYMDIYERLTGESFQPGSYPVDVRLLKNLRQAGIVT